MKKQFIHPSSVSSSSSFLIHTTELTLHSAQQVHVNPPAVCSLNNLKSVHIRLNSSFVSELHRARWDVKQGRVKLLPPERRTLCVPALLQHLVHLLQRHTETGTLENYSSCKQSSTELTRHWTSLTELWNNQLTCLKKEWDKLSTWNSLSVGIVNARTLKVL